MSCYHTTTHSEIMLSFSKHTFFHLLRENNLRKFQSEILLPPAILLLTFYFSTFGFLFTFIFLFLLLPISFYIFHFYIYCGNKINSWFCASWTISSFFILLYIFEFVVVPFLEITFWENYTLLGFVSISVIIVVFIRYQNKYSLNIDDKPIQSLMYNEWIMANVRHEHLKLYLISLVSVSCALMFGMYLSITTICHTNMKFDFLLVPDDCSEIYFDINLSLSFISALYAAMLALAISLSLIRLVFLGNKLKYQYNLVSSS